MSDTRTAELAHIIDKHYPVMRGRVVCSCGANQPTVLAWAEHVAAALTPAIDEQTTDVYLLAVAAATHDPGDDQPAHLDPAAITACQRCDDDGYRGGTVCDHRDHYADTTAGRAAVTAELAKIRNRRTRGAIA